LLHDYSPLAVRYWIGVMVVGAAWLTWALYDLLSQPAQLPIVLLLAGFASLSARFSIRIGRSVTYLSLGEVVHSLALFAFGPAAAVLTSVAEAGVGTMAATKRWSGRLFSLASTAVSTGTVAWSASALSDMQAGWTSLAAGTLLASAVIIALARGLLSTLQVRTLLDLKGRKHIESITSKWLTRMLGAFAGPACAATFIFIGYRDFGLPFLLPALAVLATVGITLGYASNQVLSRERDVERSTNEARRWRDAAQTDALTRTNNRGFFNERLPAEIERARAAGQMLSMALMDIDHFGDINKTYGWTTGDAVLQRFVQVVTSHLRSTDWLARYGGEEFALILPDTSLDNARVIAERLRAAVEGTQFLSLDGCAIPVTMSIGVAVLSDDVADATGLSTKVGQSCARAKEVGRNRVVAL
jgi:diguanylate cyclase (GGDEF)-like protein